MMSTYAYSPSNIDRSDSMLRYMEERMEKHERMSQQRMMDMMQMGGSYYHERQMQNPVNESPDPCCEEKASSYCKAEEKSEAKQDRDVKGLIAYYYHRKP